jgi:hypothetical protein
MLPAAPNGAGMFLMGGPADLIRAREVPSTDRLPSGRLRDAAAAVRKAVRVYDEIHAAGRNLLDTRGEVHAADQRNASRAVGAGKAMPEARLPDHDAELADQADRLAAAAGAVLSALRDLDAIPEDQWAKAADRIARQVTEGVGKAEISLGEARASLQGVDAVAGALQWAQRRGGTGPDPRVREAIDAVDRAQELAARVRDGDPEADPSLISKPAHRGMSSAWAQATSPLGT